MKKILVLMLILIITINLSSCGEKEKERYEAEFLTLFDTVTKIVGYTEDEQTFTKFANEFYDRLETYHQLYDIYNDYDGMNNIKTINDNAGKTPVTVDQKIIDLIKFAKEEYRITEEETNIAMGSVLNIWHQHREEGINNPERAELPSDDELEEASAHMKMEDIIVDEVASTVYLADPDMSLDVGSVGKGYAVEKVCDELENMGFTSALISVGGNVKAIGNKPGDQPWDVGVENPDKESESDNVAVVQIDGLSLVSSGDYERYYEVDGTRYHHLIDKDTLYPSTYFASVTIMCEDSGQADALSTAIYNMSYDEGSDLIEDLPDTEALWIYHDGSLRYSSGIEQYLKE